MKKGSWKKERTTGRKYCKSDVHPMPKAKTRQKIWVSSFTRKGKKIKGYFRKNPHYRK